MFAAARTVIHRSPLATITPSMISCLPYRDVLLCFEGSPKREPKRELKLPELKSPTPLQFPLQISFRAVPSLPSEAVPHYVAAYGRPRPCHTMPAEKPGLSQCRAGVSYVLTTHKQQCMMMQPHPALPPAAIPRPRRQHLHLSKLHEP